MAIKFGPAGLGGVKDAIPNLEKYHSMGLKACEIAFTYGVYIKSKEDAERIGKAAKKLGIDLSIHGPYWINLNSSDPEKIKKSIERILKCCEVGTWLQAKTLVFHPGFYGRDSKEKTYETIKSNMLKAQEMAKARGYKVKLAPETMGKVNVFGSVEEILKLRKDTHCDFCIDFAHILARYKTYRFNEVLDMLKGIKDIHVHFSGIVYGEKGEKHHKKTPEEEWKKLLEALKDFSKNHNLTIINESPEPVKDSFEGLEIYQALTGR